MVLTKDKLDGLFDLPSKAAARAIGISNNHLKRCCRKIGIDRWPYRKIQSLKNLLDRADAGLKEDINAEIDKIRRNPNRDIPDDLKALSVMSYKHSFVTRQRHGKEAYDTSESSEEPEAPESSEEPEAPEAPAPPETPKKSERRLRAFPIVVIESGTRPSQLNVNVTCEQEPVMIPVAAMQLGEWTETHGCHMHGPARAFAMLSMYNAGCCNKHLAAV